MDELPLFRSATDLNLQNGNLTFEPDMSVSQHVPLSPRSTPLPQAKFRSSCDACGQAKIKCDRSRPACARCVAQGARCVYGVSRKAGKPPRKRPATSSPPPSARPRKPATASVHLTGGGGGGYDDIDFMLTPGEDAMTIDSESPFSASYAAFQDWFASDSLGPLGGAFTRDSCMGGGQSSDSALKPAESSTSSTSSTSATSATSATTTTTATTAEPPPAAAPRHDCTRETKDLMRRLYCANPSAPVSDGVAARTLDLGSVLTRNRDVVSRLEQLLKCPCARSPHMAMLYASIVSRVLLWYKQAAWDTSSPAGAPSSSSSSSSFPPTSAAQETTSPLSSSSATLTTFDSAGPGADDNSSGVSVLPTPIMVGTFQSDDRNLQSAMTNHLILSELKKIRGLIETFISLGTGTSDLQQTAGDACPAASAWDFDTTVADASLFASLGAWLRSEHRRIVWKARSGLSVLDETIHF